MNTGISAVVPCHAETPLERMHLTACIDSLYRSPHVREVIVIDDGSPEPLERHLKAIRPELTRCSPAPVSIMRRDRKHGPASTRNIGFMEATKPWVLLMDADDRLISTAPFAQAATTPNDGFIYGDWTAFGGPEAYAPTLLGEITLPELMVQNPLPLGGVLVRKAAWQDVRKTNTSGFDPALDNLGAEDWLFWIELMAHGWKPVHVPGLVWQYRIQAGRVRDRAAENRAEIQDYIADKIKRLYGLELARWYPTPST